MQDFYAPGGLFHICVSKPLKLRILMKKAARFLMTASKSGSICITGERCFVCAQEKEEGYSAYGPSPRSDLHPLPAAWYKTAEFLEGKQVERRRKEKETREERKVWGDVAFHDKIIV